MKKFYTFMLLAMAMLGVSLQASAQLTCDIKWDIPGSVKIYVGGNSDKYLVDVPADATSYHVSYDSSYGSVYVKPTAGYFVDSAVCENDDATFTYNSWYNGISFSLTTHEAHTVKVNVSQIVYDTNLTVNMVSAGKVTATFNETGREVEIKYGEQTIEYSSNHEKTISFVGPNGVYNAETNPTGYEEGVFYLKQNGVDLNWRLFYGSWKQDEATLTGSDNFEVKVNSAIPEVQTVNNYTVTPVYATDAARSAVNMVFNVTQRKSIGYGAVEAFEVEENDVVRFAFNTLDYVVTINGAELAANTEGNSTNWETTITEDTTINISAVERGYEDVYVTIAVNDPAGLIVHNGTYDGPVIDLTAFTPISTENGFGGSNYSGYTYNVYSVPVNGKYGKAFVEPAEGWGILESLTGTGGQDIQETQAASTTSGTLHVLVHQIERASTFVFKVNLDSSATIGNIRLRNNHREVFPLVDGYNTIAFDPEWDATFEIFPIDVDMDNEKYSVYLDYVAISYNEDNSCYSAKPADGSVMYAFIKRPNAALRTLAFTLPDDVEAPTVSYDVVKSVVPTKAENTVKVFSGTEVTITLAEGTSIENYEEDIVDGVLTVKPTANETFVVYAAEVADPTEMVVTPADGATVEECPFFIVAFPNSTSVVYNEECEDDFLFMSNDMMSYAAWQFEVAELDGYGCNAFRVTPNMVPTKNTSYKIIVPEGIFTINGSLPNPEAFIIFDINKTIAPEDITYQFSPTTALVNYDSYMAAVAVVFAEEYQVSVADASKIHLYFNETELVADVDYMYMTESNNFMFQVVSPTYANRVGNLTIEMAEGALSVSGNTSPALSHTWEVVLEKDYTVDASYSVINNEVVFTVAFPEADNASIFVESYIPLAQLEEENYNSGRYIEQATSANVEAVAEATCPTYKFTFPLPTNQTPTFKFTLFNDRFLLDNAQGNPQYVMNGLIIKSSGVNVNMVEGEKVTVVTIDGRVIMINADADSVNTLAPGLYIINGQKTLK